MRGRAAYRYVEEIQRRLALEEWGLDVHTPQVATLPEGEVGSASEFCHDQPCARIEIACGRPDDQIRYTVCHELLHVRLADMRRIFELAAERLTNEAAEVLRAEYVTAEERAVTAIALALGEGAGALEGRMGP